MPRYRVNAPDGRELTVGTPWGNQQFVHGTFITDERFAKVYPAFFIEVPEFNETVIKQEDKPSKKKESVKQKQEKPKTEPSKKKNSLPKKK